MRINHISANSPITIAVACKFHENQKGGTIGAALKL